MIVKPGTLELFFNLYPQASNEISMEKYIGLYLPHRENVPSTNYTVHIREHFTGRVIGYQFFRIYKSGWQKVPLNRWPEEQRLGLIWANYSLDIRLLRGRKLFNFEDFYENDENSSTKLVPSFLTYFKNTEPNFVKDFVRFEEADSGRAGLNLPANPRRRERAIGSTSCSYTIQNMYLNLTAANATLISPGNYTTKICTGSCPPSPSTSSKCDQSVQDCCVPSKTQSFVVLYFDKGFQVVLREIPNLIVKECACASSRGNSS